MSDVKHMDIKEFRELGYLQEANRLFFHPHGLALGVTTVDEDGDAKLIEWIAGEVEGVLLDADCDADSHRTLAAMAGVLARNAARAVAAKLRPPGSEHLGGVWDYRDDPEGVVLCCGGHSDSAERAERVRAERLKHSLHRAKLFHEGVALGASGALAHSLDIEPLDYVYEERGRDGN
jgi:hypothetical protein